MKTNDPVSRLIELVKELDEAGRHGHSADRVVAMTKSLALLPRLADMVADMHDCLGVYRHDGSKVEPHIQRLAAEALKEIDDG